MRPGIKVYVRLYLAFLGVLVAIGLVSTGVAALLSHTMGPNFRGSPRVASHIARSLPSIDEPQALQQALEQVQEELGIDVAVLTPEGQLLHEAGTHIQLPGELPLQQALKGGTFLSPGFAGAPLKKSRAVLVIHLPPPAEGNRWPLRSILFVFGALLVSATLLYPLSRSITRPLETLTAAAEAFGRGDLSARSGIDAEDEVGRLARSFDEMAARIEATRRTEKELLANVSHELRTPLARLKIAIELMEPPPGPEGDSLRKRLAGISEEVEELSRLVSDVLTAARLDLSALPLRKEKLNVGELLGKARDRAQALSSQKIELTSPQALTVEGDSTLLSRALDTLVDNARKYGPETTVRIEATSAEQKVTIAVKDGGPGFEEADLPKVFDPFFRGDGARASAQGYGLGLSLARRVAEAHKGGIRARNLPEGGACVELELPLGA
ncbi:MAG: HAMP domain-containing protein [Deltaproteobacteria bacterium]|nr:HAMP domain-containing protein [Deltaproteobacteria bacterium]